MKRFIPVPSAIVIITLFFIIPVVASAGGANPKNDLRLVCPDAGSSDSPYYQRLFDEKMFKANGERDLAQMLKICANMMAVELLAGASCGNSSIELDEVCDGTNLDGATCTSLGFSAGGTLACDSTCLFDTSGCASNCADSDLDGICDSDDVCPGFNDFQDTDSDGVPSGCDICPFSALDDADGDGICENEDICIGNDASADTDGDNYCDDIDICLGDDASGDTDGDGTCDNLDPD